MLIPGISTSRAAAHNDHLCWTLGALLVLVLALGSGWGGPVGASLHPAFAAPQVADSAPDPIDRRWTPWLGCWESVTGSEELLVCAAPRRAGGITLTTFVEGEAVREETLAADGIERPLVETDCRGWRVVQWSQDDRLLFLRSEMACADSATETASGLSLLVPGGDWVDIHLLSSGGLRELLVRRFRRAGADQAPPGVPLPDLTAPVWRSRALVGPPLTVDQIIEACATVDPEAVEAVLLETDASFDIDAATLVRLAEAGVPEAIIDLMVALSFPERFVVTREGFGAYPMERRDAGAAMGMGYAEGYLYPLALFPHFAPYDAWYWYPPYHPHHPAPSPTPPERVRGRVIKGQGYTRIEVRDADAGSSGGSRTKGRSGGSSGRISSGSSSSGSSSGRVSRSGYSGTSSGRTAKPRDHR
jgi:uncharacterized membrane protein YgcG